MKKTSLTNKLLGIIAFNLTLLTLIQLDLFPSKAYANEKDKIPLHSNYGLVPLNEDGSINVNIKSSNAIMDVNLENIRGKGVIYYPYKEGAILGTVRMTSDGYSIDN